ncbi:glycosyltransferase [Aquincola tertiaricarbonis]|uniref:Glycosyltransferase n=1 Tax=Aquincola tertiaricarbonis TaxID=391953 RepID=A0ABY4SB33_AQUTE|nr:glycosyltransferase family 2 protein [Aquincola tertiaricarbonis]URI09281.1 glycosyltransferase [Aquincola tertiaricarbonis]
MASITIITSTFNCQEALRETAASIREQHLSGLQWIIADGGSTDGTIGVIEENADIVSHWHSERDRGIYDAWNKAAAHVKGDWVMFLGAGDLLLANDSLERAARALDGVPTGTLLAYGGVALVDTQGRTIQYEREVDFSRWHQGRPVLPCHQGVFQHRALLVTPQPFDSSLRICADAKLMLQAVAKAPPAYLGFDVAKMVVGGISTTTRGWLTMARENRRICEDLGLRSPLYHRVGMVRLYAKLAVGKVLGRHVGKAANAYRRLTGRKPIY